MESNEREKCKMILDEMDSLLSDIEVQWDVRHYSSLSIIKKINDLRVTVLNFDFFYRLYIERCEKESESIKDVEKYLKEND